MCLQLMLEGLLIFHSLRVGVQDLVKLHNNKKLLSFRHVAGARLLFSRQGNAKVQNQFMLESLR